MTFDPSEVLSPCKDWAVWTCYAGPIGEGVVNEALERVDSALAAARYSLGFCKKMYSTVVEGLQNLFHHADCIPLHLRGSLGAGGTTYGVFCVGMHGEEGRILMGNFVEAAQRVALIDRLERLNAMGVEEVRALYREVLNNQLYSQKGGGGLGLIDMARKASAPLSYHFSPVEGGYYFYSLLVRIQP